jgi:hypothetical protein
MRTSLARLRIRLFETVGLAALVMVVAACGAQPPKEEKSERSPDRFIYVTAQDLPGACYHELGAVEFQEPFTQAAVDRDTTAMANQLRGLAVSRYPEDADAVINVRSVTNDVGTMVTVTGEAVELKSHGTLECALREMPGVIDAAAVTAAGGIAGTVVGGLAGGSPTTAMGGAGLGAAAAAGYTAVNARQSEQQQQDRMAETLVKQRREIVQLLSERAHLRECEQQEKTLSQCKPAETPASGSSAGEDQERAAVSGLSPYEIQKQIQEQQDYIAKLKAQLSDMRRKMAGYE